MQEPTAVETMDVVEELPGDRAVPETLSEGNKSSSPQATIIDPTGSVASSTTPLPPTLTQTASHPNDQTSSENGKKPVKPQASVPEHAPVPSNTVLTRTPRKKQPAGPERTVMEEDGDDGHLFISVLTGNKTKKPVLKKRTPPVTSDPGGKSDLQPKDGNEMPKDLPPAAGLDVAVNRRGREFKHRGQGKRSRHSAIRGGSHNVSSDTGDGTLVQGGSHMQFCGRGSGNRGPTNAVSGDRPSFDWYCRLARCGWFNYGDVEFCANCNGPRHIVGSNRGGSNFRGRGRGRRPCRGHGPGSSSWRGDQRGRGGGAGFSRGRGRSRSQNPPPPEKGAKK